MEKIKLFCVSLGCDKNLVDTEKMLGVAGGLGVSFTDDETEADAILINTCCFIGDAKEESVNTILEMARYKEEGKCRALIVAGCLAQRYKQEIIDEIPEVDAILGTTSYEEIGNVLTRLFGEEKEKKEEHISCFHDLKELPETAKKRVMTTGGHYAFLKIAEGCDKRCSYCIIPFARGRVRSRRAEDIIREITGMAQNGYREIVLTGIHISSYGIDFDEEAWKRGESVSVLKEDEERRDYSGSSKLIDLLERIHTIEGIERIRIGSLEPRIITEETAARMAALPKLCPHFHLSLQSGCDATLRRMNRKYTSEEYAESVALLRKVFDHPAITTDVIVGFPGETEEEFAQTKEFLDRIQFFEMHIFKYSKRAGTRAAVMSHQVPDPVKTTRSAELLAMEKEQSKQFRTHYVGREAEVLLEETKEIGGTEYLLGHTRDYVKLAVSVKENKKNVANTVICGRVQGFLTDEILLLSPLEFSK